MAVIGELVAMVAANTKPFERGMKRAGKAAQTFSSRAKSSLGKGLGAIKGGLVTLGRSVANLMKRFAQLGVAAAAAGAAFSVKLAADFETTKVRLGTLLGDFGKAEDVLDRITKFSAKTPFQFTELTDTVTTLTTLGFGADEAMDALKMLGDVASGSGGNLNDIATIVGRIRLNGRMMTEQLEQFHNAGIPMQIALAEQFGVTKDEIRKMVSEGKIGFDDMQQALQTMTSEGGMFFGSMERQSQTFSGRWSTLKDNVLLVLREIGLGFMDAFDMKGALAGMTDFVAKYKDQIVKAVIKGAVAMAKGVLQFTGWAQREIRSLYVRIKTLIDLVKGSRIVELLQKLGVGKALKFLVSPSQQQTAALNTASTLTGGTNATLSGAQALNQEQMGAADRWDTMLNMFSTQLDRAATAVDNVATNTERTADATEETADKPSPFSEGLSTVEFVR